MKVWWDKFKYKLNRVPFICPVFHKPFWTWSGHGDFRTQHCSKCNMAWTVPIEHVVGKRNV